MTTQHGFAPGVCHRRRTPFVLLKRPNELRDCTGFDLLVVCCKCAATGAGQRIFSVKPPSTFRSGREWTGQDCALVKEGVGSRRRTAGSWHGSRAIGQLGNWVRRKAVGWWTSELVDQWIREGSGRGNAKQAIGHLGDWAGGRAVEGWIRRLVEGWRTGPHSAAPIPHSAIRTSSLCQLPAASRLLPYLNRIEGFPNRIQVRRTSTLDVGAFACTPPTWSSTSASSGPRWRRCWRSYASYETQLNRCGSIERELSLIDARERPPAEEIKCDRAAEPFAAALNA